MLSFEELKQEVLSLPKTERAQLANFLLETVAKHQHSSIPLWQKLPPQERATEFSQWVSQLPHNSPSLSDEMLSRDSIYEE
ncbi:MAG: hypothetical protein AB4058_03425 [Microcystaceae cyanobacterium]